MSAREQLNHYLRTLEKRLRWLQLSKGGAIVAGVALGATIALVLISNYFGFSDNSLVTSRVVLFLALAAALAYALILPLMRLNQKRTANRAEVVFPQFEQRLLTFVERSDSQDPMLELLALDTREVAAKTMPEKVAPPKSIFAFATGAGAAGAVLIWLILAGPGFLGFGANRLWAGTPKSGVGAAYYDIQVTPGNKTVKRKWDVPITATLVGFQAPEVRLFTKFQSTTKWESVNMLPRPASTAYEFNFAALSEPMEYYVEAAGVKSKTFKLEVVDLPAVTHITTTYHLPSWLGMKDQVEDPSGDLHAVTGTTAEVAIMTDRPLANGAIEFEDGSKIPLSPGANGTLVAKVPIDKDGLYHFASIEGSESVRLTADYFIEAQDDQPPNVRITHPGADAKVLPIEEVTVDVSADDDFALQAMDLHYSVNGGAEKVVPLLANRGVKQAEGHHVLSLEDFKLDPGDVISFYAVAKDAKQQSQTDIFFIEAQPYERNYSQSQQPGGGGAGGGGGQQPNDPNQILKRQEQIISATHNAMRPKDKSATSENAKYLSDTQLTLKKQVDSLVQRAAARELTDNASVQDFAKEMTAASQAMTPASDKLKGQSWKDALTPEEQALQHLSRAAATFRDIQVAFGRQGGGGGGGGGGANAGRDLANLFDLELDTQKNQYEQGSQASSSEQRQKEADDAMRKLEELAKRQEELARQQQNSKQLTAEQKYEQNKLKREAEDLKKQIEQLQQQQQQGGQQSQSQSQNGQQSKSGQQSSGQQASGQQSSQQGGRSGSASSQQLQRTLDQLNQAIKDMDAANRASQQGQQGDSTAQAEARKAADRLTQAADQANAARKQDAAGRVSDLKNRAEQLAQEQRDSEQKLKQQFGDPYATDPRQRNPAGANSRQAGEEAAGEKEREAQEVGALQKEIEDAARQLQTTQPNASRKLRDGLGELQQGQVQTRLQQQGQFFRQGYGNQLTPREAPITQSLEGMRDALRQADSAMQAGNQQGAQQQDREQQLANLESLRSQLQSLAQRGQQQAGNQPGGNQQGQANQGKLGQGKQGGGQQPGNQPGGQQSGQGGGGGNQPGNQRGGNTGNVNPNGGGYNNGGGTYGQNGGPFAPNQNYDPRLGPNRQNNPGVYDPNAPPQSTPQQLGANIQRQLEELRRMYKDDANITRQIQDLEATLNTNKIGDIASPELADRIGRTMLPKLEQLEVEMRRQIDEKGTGQARAGVPDTVPEGYQPQVEEYTRRLSNRSGKQ